MNLFKPKTLKFSLSFVDEDNNEEKYEDVVDGVQRGPHIPVQVYIITFKYKGFELDKE